jgi:hypothetical protein
MTILILLVCGALTDCRAVEHPVTFASRSECMAATSEAIAHAGTTARRAECVEKAS